MAQPNTQDTQKVFNSATENFKSFVGSVENVSKTKNMEELYTNLTKLFDTFTNGVLLGQGANSETLLRTVYRSLDEDFLDIIQDSNAVQKIIEIIKSKQEGISPEKVDGAMVSETTKKVVTKTLDPETCDPMQVMLDFIDELQTSILQVRLNLSREYEKRKLEYAKSLAGQQEDLDKVKAESIQQTSEISDTLGQITQNEIEWKDVHLKELTQLMEKFDQATGKKNDDILYQTLSKNDTLSEIANVQKKFDWDKLIFAIQGRLSENKEKGVVKELPGLMMEKQTIASKKQKIPQIEVHNKKIEGDQNKEKKEEGKKKEGGLLFNPKETAHQQEANAKKKQIINEPEESNAHDESNKPEESKESKESKEPKADDESNNKPKESKESKGSKKPKESREPREPKKSKEPKESKANDESNKPKESKESNALKIGELGDKFGSVVPTILKAKKNIDATKKLNEQSSKNTKLNVTPSKNGMHRCPVCGYEHAPGGPHGPENKSNVRLAQPIANDKNGTTLTQDGILSTIGKIHGNITKHISDKKFQRGFNLNYPRIQGGLLKQIKKVDESEEGVQKDTDTAQKGILAIKQESNKRSIWGSIFGGNFIFTIIGGLILIALIRVAIKKWSEAYMPRSTDSENSEGSEMTIFGIPIPGWNTVKSIGIGIWNFITVGIPNLWDRLSHFFSGLKTKLFGKKGIFKNLATVKYNLMRILIAVALPLAKKAVGWIAKALGFLLSFIPVVGPFLKFLTELIPAIFTFVMNLIAKQWAEEQISVESVASAQAEYGEQMLQKNKGSFFRNALLSNASKIKPFKGQLNAIKTLETSKRGRGKAKLPIRGAIMRHVGVGQYTSAERAEEQQSKAKTQLYDNGATGVKERLEKKDKGDILVNIHNASQEYAKFLSKAWTNAKWEYDENGQYRVHTHDEFDTNKLSPETQKQAEAFRVKLENIIMPQIKTLDAYIEQLSKSTRFKNVKGPLYDPNKGWNPGYRVLADDLRTIIPLTPFEALHKKNDIFFGQPAEAEYESVGFMPFTWVKDGIKISVHPILYELARAKAIRGIYADYLNKGFGESIGSGIFGDIVKGLDTASYAQYWQEWNLPLVTHRFGGYNEYVGSVKNVVFGNKFGKFYNKIREGLIQGEDNSLDRALSDEQVGKETKTHRLLTMSRAELNNIGMRIEDEDYSKYIKSPDVGDKTEEGKKSSVTSAVNKLRLLKNKERNAKIKSAVDAAMQSFRVLNDIELSGGGRFTYGTIRDFWLLSGAMDLLKGSTIMGPERYAGGLIWWLKEKDVLHELPLNRGNEENSSIPSLMRWFFEKSNIQGYDYNRIKGDEVAQAGFGQAYLEFLKYVALPQWNVIERLLPDFFEADRAGTAEETGIKDKITTEIMRLLTIMSDDGIFEYLTKYLRFPNMKINLIDYSNAKEGDIEKLDKFRMELGIPDRAGKDKILKLCNDAFSKQKTMSDEELENTLVQITGYLQKAEFEARFSGDYTYFKALKQFWNILNSEKQARLNAQVSGDKIVQAPGDIQVKVLERPPKSMAEIEEEKRKRAEEEEKQRAEQERKEKEDREKKLKEDAKRKEELALAKAKIEAMEAIRKQEENYESILQKMINDPGSVSDRELKSLGDEVNNLKQEAENNIAKLPREQRELKLALIRGDKISEKTFAEIKETAVGLHGNLQEYIEEVNKIPVGSVLAIENASGGNPSQPIKMQDSDSVDLGDF